MCHLFSFSSDFIASQTAYTRSPIRTICRVCWRWRCRRCSTELSVMRPDRVECAITKWLSVVILLLLIIVMALAHLRSSMRLLSPLPVSSPDSCLAELCSFSVCLCAASLCHPFSGIFACVRFSFSWCCRPKKAVSHPCTHITDRNPDRIHWHGSITAYSITILFLLGVAAVPSTSVFHIFVRHSKISISTFRARVCVWVCGCECVCAHLSPSCSSSFSFPPPLRPLSPAHPSTRLYFLSN